MRGLVIGLGLALAYRANLAAYDGGARFLAMAAIGALCYGGVDLAFDAGSVIRGERKKLPSWRLYALGVLLGGLVAGALGWYFDTPQLHVVIDKFWAYADVNYRLDGRKLGDFTTYPIFNKYGSINLGEVAGGVRLFWTELVAGVINWSLAAPLFSINYVLLDAALRRSLRPIKTLLSPAGVEGLVEQGVRVLRWGLWMAPVINSFLRQSPDPTWYNQDGAIRTGVAIGANATQSPADFRQFSLAMFTGLLAYDWLRILIWFDHMGLRVATLVNLSFLGGDRADEAAARFVGHHGRTRAIPDGIRRFGTWAPLLIPFYIPRGARVGQGLDRRGDAGARRRPHARCGEDAGLRLCRFRRRDRRSLRRGVSQRARQDWACRRHGSMARRSNLRDGRIATPSTTARWASRFSATGEARLSLWARSAAASRSTSFAGRSIRCRRAAISSM